MAQQSRRRRLAVRQLERGDVELEMLRRRGLGEPSHAVRRLDTNQGEGFGADSLGLRLLLQVHVGLCVRRDHRRTGGTVQLARWLGRHPFEHVAAVRIDRHHDFGHRRSPRDEALLCVEVDRALVRGDGQVRAPEPLQEVAFAVGPARLVGLHPLENRVLRQRLRKALLFERLLKLVSQLSSWATRHAL